MGDFDIQDQSLTAIREAIGWHTIAIDISLCSKENPVWGTGALITADGKFFIITCRHIVRPEYPSEDLRFLYRPEAPFRPVDKGFLKRISRHYIFSKEVVRSSPKTIPILNVIHSDDKDDLAILQIDPLWDEIGSYRFFEMNKTQVISPDINAPIFLMGFSKELTKRVTERGDLGDFPYFEYGQISTKRIDSDTYDSQRHFLIEFGKTEDRVEPHGLSGCGVWSRRISGPNKLWAPNIHLIGIQHSYFKKTQVLKATRIERVIQLLEEIRGT